MADHDDCGDGYHSFSAIGFKPDRKGNPKTIIEGCGCGAWRTAKAWHVDEGT